MPTYEMSVIFRVLQRPELSQAVKRCCGIIMDRGGLIRGMENLGTKPLPYKMTAHGKSEYNGNYVLIHFDGPPTLSEDVQEELKRDLDVLRRHVFKPEEFVRPCLTGPCEFGELKDPNHEKRMWWKRVAKRYVRGERKKDEKAA